MEAGLIGGKECREGRQIAFFHFYVNEIEEQFQGDMSKPRKVHHKIGRKKRS